MIRPPPGPTLFPYTTLFRSSRWAVDQPAEVLEREYDLDALAARNLVEFLREQQEATRVVPSDRTIVVERFRDEIGRSEEHTSELQSHSDLVCRLLLEKKNRWRAIARLHLLCWHPALSRALRICSCISNLRSSVTDSRMRGTGSEFGFCAE